MSELNISDEFLSETNSNLSQFRSKSRRGGPYSKHEKIIRRNKVYKLYFDYGYSGRSIAEMLKVHRNTIQGDIDFWYNQVTKNFNELDPTLSIVEQITKLKNQKTRLREYLDKIESVTEKIRIERLVFDVDREIIHIHIKLQSSDFKVHELATRWLNEFMKKNNEKQRYNTIFDTIRVSQKTHEKINKIIKEDRSILS